MHLGSGQEPGEERLKRVERYPAYRCFALEVKYASTGVILGVISGVGEDLASKFEGVLPAQVGDVIDDIVIIPRTEGLRRIGVFRQVD